MVYPIRFCSGTTADQYCSSNSVSSSLSWCSTFAFKQVKWISDRTGFFFEKKPCCLELSDYWTDFNELGRFGNICPSSTSFFEQFFFFDPSNPIFQSQTQVVSMNPWPKLCKTTEQTILVVPGSISNVLSVLEGVIDSSKTFFEIHSVGNTPDQFGWCIRCNLHPNGITIVPSKRSSHWCGRLIPNHYGKHCDFYADNEHSCRAFIISKSNYFLPRVGDTPEN